MDGVRVAGSSSGEQPDATVRALAQANETAWMQVASLAESQNDWLRAMEAYGHVLEHNEDSVQALLQLSRISQMQARYHDAVEYLHRVLKVDPSSG